MLVFHRAYMRCCSCFRPEHEGRGGQQHTTPESMRGRGRGMGRSRQRLWNWETGEWDDGTEESWQGDDSWWHEAGDGSQPTDNSGNYTWASEGVGSQYTQHSRRGHSGSHAHQTANLHAWDSYRNITPLHPSLQGMRASAKGSGKKAHEYPLIDYPDSQSTDGEWHCSIPDLPCSAMAKKLAAKRKGPASAYQNPQDDDNRSEQDQ